jgi:uncharacterized protein (DUF1684 family)
MPKSDTWQRELEEERRMKDEFMARHPESPFVAGRVPFHDLRYFPPDPKYRVRAKLQRAAVPEEAYLRTNRDGQAVMRYLGVLSFTLGGKKLALGVYHAGEGVGTSVFVPFRDRTSGDESYGPGRYVTLELNEADEYDVDFNRAFNPYCAYTDDYECGFPPAENDLSVPVRAGEKAWAADRNPRTPSSIVLEQLRKATSRPAPAPKPKAQKIAKPKPRGAAKSKGRPKGAGRSR